MGDKVIAESDKGFATRTEALRDALANGATESALLDSGITQDEINQAKAVH